MSEDLLSNLLKYKLDFAHRLIRFLPETLQDPVKRVELEFLHSVQEVVKNALEENKDRQAENSKGLKTIRVD